MLVMIVRLFCRCLRPPQIASHRKVNEMLRPSLNTSRTCRRHDDDSFFLLFSFLFFFSKFYAPSLHCLLTTYGSRPWSRIMPWRISAALRWLTWRLLE